jgi:chromosome segregation protein
MRCKHLLLKKIEIYGFKSFADRVQLKFDKGITAIVGPNGSGKSNVADAVRWVLGEQSAKSLRGSKMEDIIFSGTQVRKSLGFAEVSLTLDNSDGALPIDYTEVTITRRVFRSGDSEYYINRSACRLKDIIELFMDTGVGKEGYSIIGQGRIDEILSTRSEDRRYIFEEAAGIVKYKSRREEAEKKLERTRDNLTRVDDILSELEVQAGPLEEQSKVARVYLKLKEELKAYEINQFIHQYDRHTARIQELKAQMESLEEEIVLHRKVNEGKEAEREKLQERLNALLTEAEEIKKERYDCLNTAERLKGSINVCRERIRQAERDMERLHEEILAESSEREKKEARIQSLSGDIRLKEDQLASGREKEKELAEQLAIIEAELSRHQKEIDATKGSIMDVLSRISECNSLLTRYRTIQNTHTSRVEQLNRLMQARSEELGGLVASESEAQAEIDSLKSRYDEQRKRRSTMESEASTMKQKLSEMEAYYQNDRQGLEGKRSKLKLLEDMKKGYEGFQKSVREVLLACQRNNDVAHKVYGAVASLIRVPKTYETAIETVLGASLQHIVTETEEDAKYLIEFLRRNNYGRATFLPISSIRGRSLSNAEREVLKMKGCLGIASQLVDCDEKIKEIVENLLGRVVVADDLDSAIAIARRFSYSFRIVTLVGDVVNPGGSMTGGSSAVRGISILSRNREITELGEEISRLSSRLAADNEAITALNMNYRELKQQLENIDKDLRELEISRATAVEKAGRLGLQRSQIEKELEALKGEGEQITQSLEELTASIKESEERLAELESASSSISQSADEAEANVRQLGAQKEELNRQYTELRVENASLDREIRSIRDEIEKLGQECKRHLENISSRESKIESGREEIEGLNKTMADTVIEVEIAEKKAESLAVSLSEGDMKRASVDSGIKELESGIKEIERTIQDLIDRKYKVEVQSSRYEVELENYQNNIWDEYGLTYAGALAYQDKTLTTAQLGQQIQRVKSEITALGEVNVNAIEDYKRLSERLSFLKEQKNDLITAKENLQGIIKDITQTMEEQFKKEFAIINGYFNETFRQLFGGGSASLVLEDSNDVLSCGIDITAQPPGKKLQSLSLLSGGERALTAIAILFAILKHKPTPFCVLDEIDAALDDSNVDQYSRFVREFARDTQFVIITHRKGTMEACDVLYGIAMEEKGVSKLISVRFDQMVS